MQYTYTPINATDLIHTDLNNEAKTLADAQCASVCFEDQSTTAEVLFSPSAGRAGIAWGADAEWTDANSIEEALSRYVTGKMIN